MPGHRRARLMAALACFAAAVACQRTPSPAEDAGPGEVATPSDGPAADSPTPPTDSTAVPRSLPGRQVPVGSRVPGVDHPCGGVRVNVTVRQAALGGATDMAEVERALRSVASGLLAPLKAADAASVEISPAIRAFRFALHDPAAADAVLRRLQPSEEVETVELDECIVRTQPGRD